MVQARLLRELRGERKLSQDAVAKALHVSRPTYVALEQGKRELTLSEAERATAVFGVSLDELVLGKRHRVDAVILKKRIPKKATDAESDVRISVPQKNLEKFRQVFLYILQKVGSRPNVGMAVLYKLLYFIDFDYYEKYEEQLMGLTYIKNHHGPTPREFIKVVEDMEKNEEVEEVRSKYFSYDQRKFLPLCSPDLSLLTAQEVGLVDDVLARYGDKSAMELRKISHEDTPWAVAGEKGNLEYEHVFYRPDNLSVREYEEL